MMLADSHCHLDFPSYAEDLEQVMARAAESGVGVMLTIGTRLSTAETVIGLAERYDHVFATVGLHPHEAAQETVTVERIQALAEHPKVVGIGETGLDFYYESSPRDAQEESFRTHIAAARALDLPVVIHTRDAEEDTARIIDEEMAKGAFRGVLHCFPGGAHLAEDVFIVVKEPEKIDAFRVGERITLGFESRFLGTVTDNPECDIVAVSN